MSDNQETGPQSIDDILESQFSEQEAPTEAVEEAPSEGNEEVKAEAEETVEVETETEDPIDEPTDPETASEEPQHLNLGDYGEVTIPIIVDGVETKVNLSEAAKGYQLQADYSRKTAALANERKEMETTLQQAQAELADRRRLLDEQLAQSIEQEPDWEVMARDNPLEYLPAKENWLKKQAAQQEAMSRNQQTSQAQTHEFRQRTAEVALQSMPEWATDEGFAQNASGRMTAALGAGFTEAEYNGAVDFRLAVLLEKASRYDAQQNQTAAVEKKLASVPKVLKPSRSKGKADVQVERRAAVNRKLDQPHSMDAHLNAFMDRQAG